MLARGASLTPVWENGEGGLTFRTDDGRYIKWGLRSAETSIADEVSRMRWARPYLRVPEVIEHGAIDDTSEPAQEWLVTVAIDAQSAVSARWLAEPQTAVRAVGEGLRALHEALPVVLCPFDWSVDARRAHAESRGIRLPEVLGDPPPIDRLVVCHGDACAPNTLIGEDGRWRAHVDLGALGTADRWADIAVAAMSTEWNYGPGWEDALIEAYGLTPDRERLAFYRDLWNTT